MQNSQTLFKKILAENFGEKVTLQNVRVSSGGCISSAASLLTNYGSFFIKWGQSSEMYTAEKTGLQLLAGKSSLKIPRVVNVGKMDHFAYILMEKIDIGAVSQRYWQNLGEGLSQLHTNREIWHGLDHNNYIGSLDQENGYLSSWPAFFIEKRLEVQLKLALKKQLIDKAFAQNFRDKYDILRNIFPNDPPSLLHGDLWSGNILPAENGVAAIIDPAVYYGSREIEIAFTYLFGGFDKKFYESYEDHFPLEKGFKERIPLYNLYPLLVHANMFGASYLRSVEEIIRRFS